MLWLKSCPRCHMGDMVLNWDIYGWYISCIQCSFSISQNDQSAKDAALSIPGIRPMLVA